ncbi:MAG TPA: hypothetical protein VKF63_02520 [Terracidiphilus sp.]|nr:hypothetical protein [Terracidiphilus sp.]
MHLPRARTVAFSIAFLLLGVVAGYFLHSSPQMNDDYKEYAPLHRPKSLPENAAWVGGPDGGAYIDCYYNKLTDRDDCTVYNDGTGEIWASGSFILEGQNRGAKPSELRYSGFDGNHIFLDLPAQNGKEPSLVRANK